MGTRPTCGPALVVALALVGAGAAADARPREADAAEPPAIWKADAAGRRFRVVFDPGHRLLVGAGADLSRDAAGAQAAGPTLEVALRLRSERPAPGWDVWWTANQEIARLRLSAPDGSPALVGQLYRCLLLRESREGTLTIPSTPPLALPLPFDIGVLIEAGEARGAAWPSIDGAGAGARVAQLGIVHAEVLADFWRAHERGRWLAVGVGARHDLGLSRDGVGAIIQDHRVAPLTALSLAFHAERADGLLAGGARVEGAYQWSSRRGWERAWRAEADLETTPLALNDRPLSVFATATAIPEPGAMAPELRALVGIRLSKPLR